MPDQEPTLARDLPDALRILARANLAGVVRVTGTEGEAQLTIAEGRILFATSSRAEPLGKTLVQKGLITPDTLKGALRLQQGRGHRQPLGTILYELGLLSGRVADEQIALHIARIVHDTTSWSDGAFTFAEQAIRTDGVLASSCLDAERILLQVQLLRNSSDASS